MDLFLPRSSIAFDILPSSGQTGQTVLYLVHSSLGHVLYQVFYSEWFVALCRNENVTDPMMKGWACQDLPVTANEPNHVVLKFGSDSATLRTQKQSVRDSQLQTAHIWPLSLRPTTLACRKFTILHAPYFALLNCDRSCRPNSCVPGPRQASSLLAHRFRRPLQPGLCKE